MSNRVKYLSMSAEKLSAVLKEYSSERKGEISDLTYAASIQLRVSDKANKEKSDILSNISIELDNAKTEMCDEYCRFPYECNEEELTKHCEECPLNKVVVE